MNKKLIWMMAGAGLFALGAYGQMGDMGPGPGPGGGGMSPPPEMTVPDFEIPQELLDLREEVHALRTELWESRAAALAALGEDATLEEKRAALDSWHEANADLIADVQAKAQALHEAMAEYFPENPWFDERPVVPEEIKAKREELVQKRTQLRETRRAAIEALGPDATFEERQQALAQWRIQNAAMIEETRQLAWQVREWFRQNRPDRPDRPEDAMMQRRQQFREHSEEMHQLREQLRLQLQACETEEEREQLMNQFREQQRELMRERRELKRQERLYDAGEGGDRRPGGGG